MPRFVILRHETPPGFDRPLHWDFMLEWEGVLRTWALAEEPSPGRELAAEALADHRLAYLDYEGDVSGDRGRVSRWDRGTYDATNIARCEARVILHGDKIRGEVTLARGEVRPDQWTFLWKGSRVI